MVVCDVASLQIFKGFLFFVAAELGIECEDDGGGEDTVAEPVFLSGVFRIPIERLSLFDAPSY
jgi:hypothetical protein